MAAITALNFQKVSSVIARMQEQIEAISLAANQISNAAELAIGDRTPLQWITDINTICENIQGQCKEVSESCDTAVTGLRKYDEQLQEFVDSGINMDV